MPWRKSNCDGFFLTDQNDQALATRDAGIEQVSLQHLELLSKKRDHNSGIFRALTFMNGRGISGDKSVEFAEIIYDGAAVESDGQFVGIRIHIVYVADIAIVNFFVVVVLDLHDLIPGRKNPAEAFYFSITCGI